MTSIASVSPNRNYLATLEQKQPSSQWREVIVLKKNEKGEIIKNKEGKPLEYSYVMDAQTGDLYVDDETFTVAVKCALVFIGTPIQVGFTMLWNAGKILVDIARIAFNTLREFGRVWKEKGMLEALKSSLKYLVVTFGKAVIFQDLWHIVRAPFYGIGMLFCAVYGLINPYDARKHIAEIEHHWQGGISHEKDVREAKPNESLKLCPLVWKEEKGHVVYLAHCFQIQDNIDKSHIIFLKYKSSL